VTVGSKTYIDECMSGGTGVNEAVCTQNLFLEPQVSIWYYTCSKGCSNGRCISSIYPDNYCGDSICTGSETCLTCPQDCGACPVCTDSDGGLNYNLSGTVTSVYGSKSDFCIGNVLHESFCNRYGNIDSTEHTCQKYCSSGKCVEELANPTYNFTETVSKPSIGMKSAELYEFDSSGVYIILDTNSSVDEETNITVTKSVIAPNNVPADVPAEIEKYAYFNVETSENMEGLADNANLTFTVTKVWLSDNGLDKDDMNIYIYNYPVGWTSLDFEIQEDSDKVYYTINTHFSEQNYLLGATITNSGTNDNPGGTAGGTALPGSGKACTYNWTCSGWAPKVCPYNGAQTRTCRNAGDCTGSDGKPDETRTCTYVPPEKTAPVIVNVRILNDTKGLTFIIEIDLYPETTADEGVVIDYILKDKNGAVVDSERDVRLPGEDLHFARSLEKDIPDGVYSLSVTAKYKEYQASKEVQFSYEGGKMTAIDTRIPMISTTAAGICAILALAYFVIRMKGRNKTGKEQLGI
jgi:PGF-pre-PGF domain-containing protein